MSCFSIHDSYCTFSQTLFSVCVQALVYHLTALMHLERQGIMLFFEVLCFSWCSHCKSQCICTSWAVVLQERSYCRGRYPLSVFTVMGFTSVWTLCKIFVTSEKIIISWQLLCWKIDLAETLSATNKQTNVSRAVHMPDQRWSSKWWKAVTPAEERARNSAKRVAYS